MLNSYVREAMVLGDIQTGIGADPIRVAFSKYNTHYHSDVSFPNYLLAGVQVGHLIVTTLDCSLVLFSTGTTVTEVELDSFIISSPALATIEDVTLVLSYLVNDETVTYIVPGCNLTEGSITVRLSKIRGFVSPASLAQVTYFSGFLNDITTNYMYPICPCTVEDMYLHSLSIAVRIAETTGQFDVVIRDFMATSNVNDVSYSGVSVPAPNPDQDLATVAIKDFTSQSIFIPSGSTILLKASNATGSLSYNISTIPIRRYVIDV